jgi:hypothetical protein
MSQPWPASHGLEAEDVAEECAVRLGVFAVDEYVRARDHLPLLFAVADSAEPRKQAATLSRRARVRTVRWL